MAEIGMSDTHPQTGDIWCRIFTNTSGESGEEYFLIHEKVGHNDYVMTNVLCGTTSRIYVTNKDFTYGMLRWKKLA